MSDIDDKLDELIELTGNSAHLIAGIRESLEELAKLWEDYDAKE